MARYLGEWVKDPKPELVFNAAEYWRDRCLLDSKSVFTNKQLWTKENFEELQNYFIRKLIEGEKGKFINRLETRLRQAPLEVKQLTAEIFWVMLLMPFAINIPYVKNSHVELSLKRKYIETIWSWPEKPSPQNTLNERGLIDCLKQGIVPVGARWLYYWQGLYYFIIWLQHWKSKSSQKQRELIADYQRFGQDLQDWEDRHRKGSLKNTRKLLGKGIKIWNTAIRHVILYLLFPDYFERIVNVEHKKKIIANFPKKKVARSKSGRRPNWDDDKLLWELRQKEEERRQSEGLNKNFDFFDPMYRDQWDPGWSDSEPQKEQNRHPPAESQKKENQFALAESQEKQNQRPVIASQKKQNQSSVPKPKEKPSDKNNHDNHPFKTVYLAFLACAAKILRALKIIR